MVTDLASFLASRSSTGTSSGSLEISSLAEASIVSAWADSQARLWEFYGKNE